MLQQAEEYLKSHLWVMLTDPLLRLEDHRQFISSIISKRGWYRAGAEDRRIVGAFLLTDPMFGYPEGVGSVYSAMLTHLETHPSADHVALLAALFREAIVEVQLSEAQLLRTSLLTCVHSWAHSLGMPALQHRLLVHLVEQRLVHGWWFTPDLNLKAYGSQRRYVQAMLKAHTATPVSGMTDSCATRPIVLLSPRVAWIDAHRDILEPVANKLFGPDAIGGWRPGDSDKYGLRDNDSEAWPAYLTKLMEEENAWHDHADWASKAIKPPPQDMRYCLPVEPGSQDDRYGYDRPFPYLADGQLDTPKRRTKRLASEPGWKWGDPAPPLDASKDDKT
ncbi:MAG TPA: hypothetical protein VGV14_16380 [Rhodanobacter sp.]|nr:hypothetical protein [Rhodanobacter sp.]